MSFNNLYIRECALSREKKKKEGDADFSVRSGTNNTERYFSHRKRTKKIDSKGNTFEWRNMCECLCISCFAA